MVSIAAQLATLPITIYYFHQFPNWFLLTNLIAIPLAFIAVGLSAVVSIFYILFDSDFYFAELLEFILRALNSVVEFVDQLPFTIIDNIWVEPISTLLILLALILVVIHFHFYNIRLILSALTLLVCVFLIEFYTSSKYLGSNEFTVYSFKNKLAVSLRLGSKARVYSYDTLNLYESKIVRNHLHAMEVEKEDYILLNQIKQDDFCLVKEGFAIFQFKNQLIGITEDMSEVDYLSRIGINYLILDGYPPEKWNYKTKIIATTSSIELNNDINISNYYSLRDQGAFRLSL